jgi:hypothetical protein
MATNPKDVPQHYYSLNEYFALEQASDARFEYWDGDIVCMSGGSRAHGIEFPATSTSRSLVGLRGGRCQAFTGDAAAAPSGSRCSAGDVRRVPCTASKTPTPISPRFAPARRRGPPTRPAQRSETMSP